MTTTTARPRSRRATTRQTRREAGLVKKSGLWASIILFVGLVIGLLGLNLGLDNHPVLGLDLRGGVSVILAPEIDGTSSEDLGFVRDLVRDLAAGCRR